MQFILGLGTMLVVVLIFTKLRTFIFNKVKKNVLMYPPIVGLNASIGKSYPKEKVSRKKFLTGMLSLKDPVGWLKDIVSLFNLRKLTIYCIVLGAVFGYAYFKGQGNTPVKINLDYAKEFKMKLDGHYLVKPKNSQNIRIEDKEGNVIKDIKAKDFPLLSKKLKPIGFILEPIGIAGLGAGGENNGFEGGAGVSFIKYWQYRLDGFLTNRGIYLGTSYQITDNSGLGVGAGKGFKGDNRAILYYKWKF